VNKLGFQVSPHDHCLFIRHDCIIVTWVDDAIILTIEPGKADQIIADIKSHGLDLDKQSNSGLAEYLGIDIKARTDGSLEMSQRGLINRIIESMDLKNAMGKPLQLYLLCLNRKMLNHLTDATIIIQWLVCYYIWRTLPDQILPLQ